MGEGQVAREGGAAEQATVAARALHTVESQWQASEHFAWHPRDCKALKLREDPPGQH